MPQFRVERLDQDGVCVLRLSGELDLATVDQLRSALNQALDGQRVVVDTTELAFIDLTGLDALVDGRNKLGGDNLTVVLGRATERLFDLAGVKAFFDLE